MNPLQIHNIWISLEISKPFIGNPLNNCGNINYRGKANKSLVSKVAFKPCPLAKRTVLT